MCERVLIDKQVNNRCMQISSKKSLFVILFSFLFLNLLSAQEVERYNSTATPVSETDYFYRDSMKYEGNEQWYIQIQGGGSYSIAENTRFGSFSDGLSPSYAFIVGKNFTTVWGIRLQALGGGDQGRFHSSKTSPTFDFKHISGILQATFNITNFIRNAERGDESQWNLIFMGGPGITHTYDFSKEKVPANYPINTSSKNHFLLAFAIEFSYRASEHWNINLEANTSWAGDKYNGIDFDRPLDGMVNLLLGVRYTF